MSDAPAPSAARWSPWVALLGGLLVLNALGWLLGAVPVALRYPYGIDFGEGLILNQARRLLAGEIIYGPVDQLPYIVANYPPLFYLLNAAAAKLLPAVEPLMLGRLLAIIGNLGIMGALFALVRRQGATAPLWLWLIPLCWLLTAPAWRWGLVVRVDTIAIALSLWGLYWATAEKLGVAFALFFGALSTKHSMVSAALSAVLRRDATGIHIRSPQFGLFLGLMAIVIVGLALFPGDVDAHIRRYTANEFHFARLLAGLSEYLAISLPLWVLLLVSHRDLQSSHETAPWCIYLVLSTLTLVTFAATGSDSNYYLEPLAALLAMIIVATGGQARQSPSPPAPLQIRSGIWSGAGGEGFPWNADATVFALLIAFAATNRWGAAGEFPLLADPAGAKRGGEEIVARLRESAGPALSEDYTFLLKAGKTPDFQPYIFRLLAETGKWDEEPFIAMLRAQYYDQMVLRTNLFEAGNAEEAGADTMGAGFDRLSPQMEEAIRANYELDPRGPVLADGVWFLYRSRRAGAGGN